MPFVLAVYTLQIFLRWSVFVYINFVLIRGILLCDGSTNNPSSVHTTILIYLPICILLLIHCMFCLQRMIFRFYHLMLRTLLTVSVKPLVQNIHCYYFAFQVLCIIKLAPLYIILKMEFSDLLIDAITCKRDGVDVFCHIVYSQTWQIQVILHTCAIILPSLVLACVPYL